MTLFRKSKIISVNNVRKKEHIQEVFARHNIDYKMKVRENLQKNIFDTARLGSLGNNKVKLIYSFFVDKDNMESVKHLLKGAGLM